MRKLFCSAIIFFLLASAAFADEKADKRQFQGMDSDQNGKVTATEHADFWKRWFVRQDKNKDGVLEFDEFDNSPVFARIDKNEDGKIDPDENKLFFARQFKVLDANQDGHVTWEEYAKKRDK